MQTLKTQFAWVPGWAITLVVVGVALVLAQLFYNLIVRMLARLMRGRGEFTHSLIVRTRGPGRLAILIAAISWGVHAAPFDPRISALVQHGLLVAFICLWGWMLLTASDIASALYMRRYRVDVSDNLLARKHLTQVRILRRALGVVIIVLTVGIALMTIPGVRRIGVSLLAAGGAAGIIVGLALQPILSNIMAGVQIALTQPIRIEDAVFVNGEFGFIEEINSTYVVIRIWDLRRMVVPLKFFLDQPFQNWTRDDARLLGAINFYLDYRTSVDRFRAKFEEVVRASPLWDGELVKVQVNDIRERVIDVRGLLSAATAGNLSDLRAEVREKVIAWLQAEMPEALPRDRQENMTLAEPDGSGAGPRPGEQRVQ
jgi:small-conductance mechanosensitive channel